MSPKPQRTRRTSIPYLIGTWFGCGFSPVASGTVGSLAALVIAIVLNIYAGSGRGTFLLLAAILLFPGIWAADVVARSENIIDPHIVVVDEVIGQWITLAGAATLNWETWLAAFLFFRLFDIWKPPPVRQLEHLPGGWGIVADDVMAGVYGALAIVLLDRFHIFSYGF
jgi:phosphatidylglycerophosphatase A